jgi:hypothetical protein
MVQLLLLKATVIWAAVEIQRECLLSLYVDYVGNPRIANSSEACGGPSRLSVYSNSSITPLPIPTAQTTNLPGNWQYSGCLAYVAFLNVLRRAESWMLTPVRSEPNGGRVFKNQVILTQNNSAQTCLTLCFEFGYPAAGMEYGDECCK